MIVYCIEYVSYRQGPYRIRIDTADDRIVPALLNTVIHNLLLQVTTDLHQALKTDKVKCQTVKFRASSFK